MRTQLDAGITVDRLPVIRDAGTGQDDAATIDSVAQCQGTGRFNRDSSAPITLRKIAGQIQPVAFRVSIINTDCTATI